MQQQQQVSKPAIFVETTVPIDLLLGEEEMRQKLRTFLESYDAQSSTYMLMEFHRTVVHALRSVRHLAVSCPEGRAIFPYILRNIPRISPFSARHQKRCHDLTISILEGIEDLPGKRGAIVSYINTLLAMSNDLMWLGINIISNNTDCDLVRSDREQGAKWLTRVGPERMSCTAKKASCLLNNFLESHQSLLPGVRANCMASSDFDDGRAISTLQLITGQTRIAATGENKCWYLGDVIMALEAVSVGRILSSNIKHYRPICDTVGVDLVPYPV